MSQDQGVPPETVETDRAQVESHAAALGLAAPKVARLLPGAEGISGLAFGNGARFVFLHGGQMNAHTWNGVILRLGVPALAYDLPGHGHSARLDASRYSIAEISRRLADRICNDCDEGVLIVGHSLGGVCAIQLADRLGARAAGLVLIDSSPNGIGAPYAGPAVPMQGRLEDLADSLVPRAPNRSRTALERGVRLNTRDVGKDLREWLWDPGFLAAAPLRRAEREGLWAMFGALGCQKALIHGGASEAFSAADAEHLRAYSPAMRLHCVAAAGHNVHTDAPAEVARILRTLLKDVLA